MAQYDMRSIYFMLDTGVLVYAEAARERRSLQNRTISTGHFEALEIPRKHQFLFNELEKVVL